MIYLNCNDKPSAWFKDMENLRNWWGWKGLKDAIIIFLYQEATKYIWNCIILLNIAQFMTMQYRVISTDSDFEHLIIIIIKLTCDV